MKVNTSRSPSLSSKIPADTDLGGCKSRSTLLSQSPPNTAAQHTAYIQSTSQAPRIQPSSFRTTNTSTLAVIHKHAQIDPCPPTPSSLQKPSTRPPPQLKLSRPATQKMLAHRTDTPLLPASHTGLGPASPPPRAQQPGRRGRFPRPRPRRRRRPTRDRARDRAFRDRRLFSCRRNRRAEGNLLHGDRDGRYVLSVEGFILVFLRDRRYSGRRGRRPRRLMMSNEYRWRSWGIRRRRRVSCGGRRKIRRVPCRR